MTAVLETARRALEHGFCPVPPREDGSKAPDGPWKERQLVRPTPTEVDLVFTGRHGIGLVCGGVSGGLEMLELEGRAVDDGLGQELEAAMVAAGIGDVWERIVAGYLEHSPSGGFHVLWRCDEIDGNLKLARRPGPDGTTEVLIETRGEGGYVVIAPSNGPTHPSGRPWVLQAGGLATVARLTPEERAKVLEVARSFDTMPAAPPAPLEPRTERMVGAVRTDSWMDDTVAAFNAATSWAQILGAHGWTHHHRHGEVDYWTRPGKESRDGHSATTNANGTDRLIVFSSSVGAGLEVYDGQGHAPSYDRFGVWAALEHQGDRLAAARAAREAGHGPTWSDRRVVDWGDILPSGHPELFAGAPTNATEPPDGPTSSTWEPIDLGPTLAGILAGTIVRQEPTIGLVEGAPALFVAGKVNGLHGGPATGKTMLTQVIARQLLEAGDTVWFLDFEDDHIGAVLRLLDLGTDPDAIAAGFRYRRPDQVLDLVAEERLLAALQHDRPTLVIVDSTGEWMGLHGIEDRDDHVARFMATCARPLTATGAAVVLLDHVPHAEKERLAPIGSQRKLAAINGVQYLVTTVAEMARGRVGKARITVAKDRTGTRPKATVAAELLLDATTTPAVARLTPPTTDKAADAGPLAGLPPAARRTHNALAAADGPLDVRAIGDLIASDGTTGTGLKTRTIQDALVRLKDAGLANRTHMGVTDLWSHAQPAPVIEENTP